MSELKPGQKFPTPTPGFGDRVFYETLLKQRPDSFMAQEWCVHYGVLPYDEAERLYKAVTDRKRKAKGIVGGVMVTPTSSSPVKSSVTVPKKVKKEKPDTVTSQKMAKTRA